ncbi:aflatoxin b1-aldehyde reductase [Westerdykella ornata]|uniref:Aflatoxin b1-aldehyde reductase n=1 Tax=Westerdykella ornata TaxID=318751 RepID=A0A6A6JB23_WESOR|nr:aflatoxin b1-aldehyde reductase [Westerdykella ornata]KAF2272826.1 aflatoxin b1-aldehyde reductase [Westerdykella ornata]
MAHDSSSTTNGTNGHANGNANGNGTTNSPATKTALKVVFGAMTFGRQGAEQARIHDLKDCAAVLDVLQAHGHNEIDTARIYAGGSSEEYLGQLDLKKRGILIDTKLSPRKFGPKAYSHKPEGLKLGLEESLVALKTDKLDCWYLHAPDPNTPYAVTLKAVNDLYQAGHFTRFGISNYTAWEVAQISELCIANGWKRPDVYQGCYHALQRSVEPELLPCLRHYGIAFYCFSPLAGGMLTDKYQRDTTEVEPGSRFDPNRMQGKNFRGRYWNEAYFSALDVIRPVAKKLGLSTAEAASRWVMHHSALRKEHGDAVIIGASSAAQLEENLVNLEKGPLPAELVEAFEEAWRQVKGVAGPYY